MPNPLLVLYDDFGRNASAAGSPGGMQGYQPLADSAAAYAVNGAGQCVSIGGSLVWNTALDTPSATLPVLVTNSQVRLTFDPMLPGAFVDDGSLQSIGIYTNASYLNGVVTPGQSGSANNAYAVWITPIDPGNRTATCRVQVYRFTASNSPVVLSNNWPNTAFPYFFNGANNAGFFSGWRHDHQITVWLDTTVSGGTTTHRLRIWDDTAGTVLFDDSLTDTSTANQVPGRVAVGYSPGLTLANLQIYDLGTAPGMTIQDGDSPIYGASTAGQVVNLVGNGTSWTAGTTFSLSGTAATGSSVTGKAVADGSHAALTLTIGSTPGPLVISDGTNTTQISVNAAATNTTIRRAMLRSADDAGVSVFIGPPVGGPHDFHGATPVSAFVGSTPSFTPSPGTNDIATLGGSFQAVRNGYSFSYAPPDTTIRHAKFGFATGGTTRYAGSCAVAKMAASTILGAAIGDSKTQNIYLLDTQWCKAALRTLEFLGGGRKCLLIDNGGVGGTQASQWLPGGDIYIAWKARMQALVAAGMPPTDLFLWLGHNDCSTGGVAAATFGSNMAAIVAAAIADVPSLVRIWIPYPGYFDPSNTNLGPTFGEAALNLMFSYDAQIDAIAAASTTPKIYVLKSIRRLTALSRQESGEGLHDLGPLGEYRLGVTAGHEMYEHLNPASGGGPAIVKSGQRRRSR